MAEETRDSARTNDQHGGALTIVRDRVILDVCIGVSLAVFGAGSLIVREGLAVDQALVMSSRRRRVSVGCSWWSSASSAEWLLWRVKACHANTRGTLAAFAGPDCCRVGLFDRLRLPCQ